MKLRTKLLVAFASNAVLIIGIGIFMLVVMAILNIYNDHLTNDTIPALTSVEQISTNLARFRALQATHIAVKNDTDRAAIEQALDKIDQQQQQLIETYTERVADEEGADEERAKVGQLAARWTAFVEQSRTILIPTSRQNLGVTAYAVYAGMESDYDELSTTIAGIVATNQREVETQQARNQSLQQQARIVIIVITLASLALAALLWRLFSVTISRNVERLVAATQLVAAGTYDRQVEVRGRDELAELARSFNQMQTALHGAQTALDAQQSALEARTRELEATLAELHTTERVRDELSETIRSLESPVLPVIEGVLVLPLTGTIDSKRAMLLAETQLEAITRYRAHTVIVDVTGVPIVDTAVAAALLHAAEAARLLGAETVLVGLRPELAHTIVGLGLDLTQLVTRADLADGVRYAIGERPRRGQLTAQSSRLASAAGAR